MLVHLTKEGLLAITGEGDEEGKWGEVYDNTIDSLDRFTEVKEGGRRARG